MSKYRVKPEKVLYDFSTSNGEVVYSDTNGPSLTRQEFADECDINVLMQRYEKTGMPATDRVPQFVDFTAIPSDLMGTLNMFDEAQAAFMQLPAGVRREFNNSPEEFVEFASAPENLEQMREWGLAAPLPAATVVEAPAPVAKATGAPPKPAEPAPKPAPPASSTVTD